MRKYAALDAELVANYFQAVGGVPVSNVRVLVDWKALRPDIEETILDWLPAHVTADSLVVLYFAGQAKVLPSGETFLVLYESGPSASQLYPVKDLLAGLGRLKARCILLIFDGAISKLGDAQVKSKDPQWGPAGNGIVRLIGTTGIRTALEPEKLHHGLTTYYLLRGLRGEADGNLDREVTLGELTQYLEKTIPGVARREFQYDQRPLILPPIRPSSKFASVLLTRTGPPTASNTIGSGGRGLKKAEGESSPSAR